MIDNKFRHILRGLLEKSRSNEVSWQDQTATHEISVADGSFFVDFPHSRLSITYRSPTTEPDKIEVWIDNERGQRAVSLETEVDDDDWELALAHVWGGKTARAT
jgi:hypothetical protein